MDGWMAGWLDGWMDGWCTTRVKVRVMFECGQLWVGGIFCTISACGVLLWMQWMQNGCKMDGEWLWNGCRLDGRMGWKHGMEAWDGSMGWKNRVMFGCGQMWVGGLCVRYLTNVVDCIVKKRLFCTFSGCSSGGRRNTRTHLSRRAVGKHIFFVGG